MAASKARILAAVLSGAVMTASAANRIYLANQLAPLTFSLQLILFFGAFSLAVYYLVVQFSLPLWKRLPALGRAACAAACVLGAVLLWLAFPAPQPQMERALKIQVDKSNPADVIRLAAVQVNGNPLPLEELAAQGKWKLEFVPFLQQNVLAATPKRPLSLTYTFNGSLNDTITLTFLSHPRGGSVKVNGYPVNLTAEKVATLPYSLPKKTLPRDVFAMADLFCLGVMCFAACALVFYATWLGWQKLTDKLQRLWRFPAQFLFFPLAFLVLLALTGCFNLWWQNSAYKDNQLVYSYSKPLPDPREYVLAYNSLKDERIAYDRLLFFQNIDRRLIENLKAADVVFAGSSFCMYAFADDAPQLFFERHGLRYFLLCMPQGNIYTTQYLFDLYNLHPKALVLFHDEITFDREVWDKKELQTAADKSYRLPSFRALFNETTSLYINHLIHRGLPGMRNILADKAAYYNVGGSLQSQVMFRERRDGTYLIYALSSSLLEPSLHWYNNSLFPLKEDGSLSSPYISDEALRFAKKFSDELRNRNTQFIIAPAPHRIPFAGQAKYAAEKLKVPYFSPPMTSVPVLIEQVRGHITGTSLPIFNEIYLDALAGVLFPSLNATGGKDAAAAFFDIAQYADTSKPIPIQHVLGNVHLRAYYNPQAEFTPELTDSNPATFWSSYKYTERVPETLALDLGQPRSVAGVRWLPHPGTPNLWKENPRLWEEHPQAWQDSFTIYTGNEGQTWQLAAQNYSYTVKNGDWVELSFPPTTARYVLIYLTTRQYQNPGTSSIQVAEIEAFAPRENP